MLRRRSRSAATRLAEAEQELAEYRRGWPPGHFYSPIPALDEVERDEHRIFRTDRSELPGIDLRDDAQLDLLDRIATHAADHPWGPERRPGVRYQFDNPNFQQGEALVLHGILREYRPRRLVEVGSGHSSCAVLDTDAGFLGGRLRCTFIEPYPDLLRSRLEPSDRPAILEARLQDVPLETFDQLQSGDVLLVDSTHVLKTGSDVALLLGEVFPRLAVGVLIHIHDIHFPFEYPKAWVMEGRAWNEAYAVRAFLTCNEAFEILLFNSHLAQRHADRFFGALPEAVASPGSSLWLRRVR